MICPKCKYEYVDDIKVCPDCDTELVDKIEEPQETFELLNEEDYVTFIYRANPIAVGMAKGLLHQEGIKYIVKNEEIQDLMGAGRLGTGYNVLTGPVQIIVSKKDEARARELLDIDNHEIVDENFDENTVEEEISEEDAAQKELTGQNLVKAPEFVGNLNKSKIELFLSRFQIVFGGIGFAIMAKTVFSKSLTEFVKWMLKFNKVIQFGIVFSLLLILWIFLMMFLGGIKRLRRYNEWQ